jgi:hypothetical protein
VVTSGPAVQGVEEAPLERLGSSAGKEFGASAIRTFRERRQGPHLSVRALLWSVCRD